jgi:hypothetical protein
MSTRMARTANRRCERLHSLTLLDFFVLTANRLENASRFELSFRVENVRKGSNPEILTTSRCFPLFPRKRTQVGHRAMSEKCRYCCKSLFRVKYENFKDR